MTKTRGLGLLFFLVFFALNASPAILANSLANESGSEKHFLFIVLSKDGLIERADKKQQWFSLTLKNVNPKVIYFADWPARFSGQLDLNLFLKQWSQGEFKKKPANGLMEVVRLTTIDQLRHSASYAVALADPVYTSVSNQLVFKIFPLQGNKMDLPDMANSDYIALFIDGKCLICSSKT
ncbi:hypothetical protein [Legionella micdadei]|uniref:Uncharacterized protein n=1 Tax=Legionella micdadei TaxID=451 RepID=A0A098GJT5_LEGMI|nr:hypothetical protein [Legionella micdadei]ARG98657.1 hypothetical protein B6N58_13875 [Legionella micdadei]ARH01370.1 hypothetical protein B6V88_13730 [Legionella micdadei]KTD28865.1 hypothetical protein Lmic_0785 [Legionella micdadei]NSL17077.1 hypothetical protein [Legionella micdadei]CEG62245.1 exported protein of unknown function [Legionella micdadei]